MRLYPDLVPGLESTLHLYPKAVRFWQALEAELGGGFDLKVTGGLMVAESREQLDFLAVQGRARAKTRARRRHPRPRRARADRALSRPGRDRRGALPPRGQAQPAACQRRDPALGRRRSASRIAAGGCPSCTIETQARRLRADHAARHNPRRARWCSRRARARKQLAADLGVDMPAEPEPLHMNITEPTGAADRPSRAARRPARSR